MARMDRAQEQVAMKPEKIFDWKSVKRASKRLVLKVLLTIHGTGSASVCAPIRESTSTGPDAGPIQALAIDPHTADPYAAVLSRGLFKTTDGGASWGRSGVPTGILVFDPQNPSTMYAV